jgi:hypothetical protein
VYFGNSGTFHIDSDAQITATLPAAEAPNFVVDVSVSYQPDPHHSPVTVVAPGEFTYLTAPAITSISPPHG